MADDLEQFQDKSGSIRAAAASQLATGALKGRRVFFFQNLSANTMWLQFGVAAVQDAPSIALVGDATPGKGATFTVAKPEFVDERAVYVIGVAVGDKFVAKEG